MFIFLNKRPFSGLTCGKKLVRLMTAFTLLWIMTFGRAWQPRHRFCTCRSYGRLFACTRARNRLPKTIAVGLKCCVYTIATGARNSRRSLPSIGSAGWCNRFGSGCVDGASRINLFLYGNYCFIVAGLRLTKTVPILAMPSPITPVHVNLSPRKSQARMLI